LLAEALKWTTLESWADESLTRSLFWRPRDAVGDF